jgi:hypothetical protein
MKLEFLGIAEALKRDWIIMEFPPPATVRMVEREAYEARWQRLRQHGAVIVGFKKAKLEATRVWFFGRPRGDVDATWMKDLAEKAGMLLPSNHGSFTFRWLWRDPANLSVEDRVQFSNDALSDKLMALSKDLRIPEGLRREAKSCALFWDVNQFRINKVYAPLRSRLPHLDGYQMTQGEKISQGLKLLGRIGGKVTAARRTREQREEAAKHAIRARWEKWRKKKR